MWTDPIVEELHRLREDHAARFQYDLQVIVRDLRKLEQDWPAPKIDPPPKSLADVSRSGTLVL